MSHDLFISSNQTRWSAFNSEKSGIFDEAGKVKKRSKPAAGSKTAVQEIPIEDPPPRRTNRFEPPAPTHEETTFRHSGWKAKRSHVHAALTRAKISAAALERFENCGSGATVEWSEKEQRHRVSASFCKCRHCEPCMKARATKVRLNLMDKLKDQEEKRNRFITLTLRHSDASLADMLKKLYRSFSKLRGMKLWKKSQEGGAFLTEVKLGQDKRWHPHLHIVCEGGWIDQRELSAAWLKCTGDSHVVDIRLLHRTKDAVNYLAKYITKGCSANVWDDPTTADEWVSASRSLRICSTFGTWRGLAMTAVNQSANDWEHVANLTDLYTRAAAGEEHAQNLLKLLRGPTAVEVDADRPKPPPDEALDWM